MIARKAPRVPAPARERHALLGDALHMGTLAFLALRDTAVTLNCCCRTLRNDAQLALSALLETGPATKYGRHLFQGCGSDWFAAGDRALEIRSGRDCDAAIARLFEKWCEEVHFASCTAAAEPTNPRTSSAAPPVSSSSSNPLRGIDVPQRPWFSAQLLSLIAAFDKFVLPLLPDKKTSVDAPYWSDENIYFVPMAIALCLYLPKRQETKQQQEWARDDVRKALNASSLWEVSGFRCSKAELVGGVVRSAFFVGALVITY